MIRIGKYILYDISRSRFVMLYAVFLMVMAFTAFSLDSDAGKSTLSLLNIVMLVVPMMSVIFTTIHFYNSYEFIELLLAQPVNRRTIFLAEYASVSFALSFAFLIGVGIPVAIFHPSVSSIFLIVGGVLLTFVFVAVAFAASVPTRDKARGIGVSLLAWLYFTLIYDGFVLYIIYAFSDYPLEKVTLALITLNPVDLARIMILLKLDAAALMGYTGAFYQSFFANGYGVFYALISLLIWIAAPLLFALRTFNRKDI